MHLTVKRFQLFYCFYYKTIKSKYHIWTCFFFSCAFYQRTPQETENVWWQEALFQCFVSMVTLFSAKAPDICNMMKICHSFFFFFLFECSKAGGRRFQKFQVTDTRRAVFRFLLWKWCWNLTADSTLDGESDTGWSMTFLETTKNPCSGDPLII